MSLNCTLVIITVNSVFFFFSSRRRHTRCLSDWSSDVCSSDLPDGTKMATEHGTPQGGPLSPLLSNIVLDEWDQELERRGLRFVRYADDCNIFVRSERAGQRVMESTRKFLERKLRLQINEEKSSVTSPENVHFLGFRFSIGDGNYVKVKLSTKTKARLGAKIRELTPRSWGHSRLCLGRQLDLDI